MPLPARPDPLPEGVVGYTFGGKPVYDGDWFDQAMNRPGTITVRVNSARPPLRTCSPETS